MNSAQYINSIHFDHVETWAFTWENYKHSIITEAHLHQPNSKLTGTFKSDHPTAKRFVQILQTEIEESFAFLCETIYREALVFYDGNDKIISILNICLTCFDLHAEPHSRIKGDYKAFDGLKRLFIELGHEVQNPGYSIIEDVEKQLKKIR